MSELCIYLDITFGRQDKTNIPPKYVTFLSWTAILSTYTLGATSITTFTSHPFTGWSERVVFNTQLKFVLSQEIEKQIKIARESMIIF